MKYPWDYLIVASRIPAELEGTLRDVGVDDAKAALEDLGLEPWLKELIRALLFELDGDLGSALSILEGINEKNFYVLYNELRLYTVVGNFENAELCEGALKKIELDKRQSGLVENERGKRMWKKSAYKEAINSYTEMLQTALELGDRFLESIGYNNIAIVMLDMGDYQQAKDLFRKSLEIDIALKNERDVATTELNLGECCRMMGDLETAKEFFNECLDSCAVLDSYNNSRLSADCYWNLGQIYMQERDFEKARDCLEKAFELGVRTGDDQLLVRIHLAMGSLEVACGSPDEAREHMRSAYERAKAIGSKRHEAESYALRGRIFEKERKYSEALQSYGLAAFLFRQISDKYDMAKMEEAAGSIYLVQGNTERAVEYFKKAKAKYAALSYADFVAIDEKLKEAEGLE
jgi:tetratricopeptide (TPR) repeat protein